MKLYYGLRRLLAIAAYRVVAARPKVQEAMKGEGLIQ